MGLVKFRSIESDGMCGKLFSLSAVRRLFPHIRSEHFFLEYSQLLSFRYFYLFTAQ